MTSKFSELMTGQSWNLIVDLSSCLCAVKVTHTHFLPANDYLGMAKDYSINNSQGKIELQQMILFF